MKEKVYTEAVVEKMVAEYRNAKDAGERADVVRDFAETLKVKEASVRSKLVNLGVYVAKAKEAKKGSVTKADIVAKIAKVLNVTEEAAGSLENSNKSILKLVAKALGA